MCGIVRRESCEPRRFGIINWQLILIFAGYNLLAEFILDFGFWMLDYKPTRIHNLKPRVQNKLLWRVIIDLPAAGLVYFSSATPGAPQFDLIFLAVLCAAVSMPLRISLVYTAAAVAVTAIIEPTLPLWTPSAEEIRELGARMDAESYGGAALLGLEGTVVIAHGASTAKGIASACQLAGDLSRGRITEKIREQLGPARGGHFLRRHGDRARDSG